MAFSILGRTEAQRLDERFIQPIDLDDNTGCGGALPDLIADFNPLWDSGADPDQRFLEGAPDWWWSNSPQPMSNTSPVKSSGTW